MNNFGVITEAGAVRFERVLPGPIERVWSYLTDSEKRGTWLATGDMELRPGGKVTMTWDNSRLTAEKEAPPEYKRYEGRHSATWTIVRVEKPRLLACIWPMPIGDTEVTFELTERGRDVVLVLTHRRLDRQTMLNVGPGWHAHLAVMADRLRGVEPGPFWTHFAGLKAEYEKRL
jgi:uncharacterized protein YndB with AHSA1/START domain